MTTAQMTNFLDEHNSCPHCRKNIEKASVSSTEAQQQIDDLKAQVQILTMKTIDAVEKWADYEDQIRVLQAQTKRQSVSPAHERRPSARSSSILSGYSFSSFLGTRRATQVAIEAPLSPTTELVEELSREKKLRQAAEGKLSQTSGELEELSSQLFMQANEMVATERRARAKLETRVEILERRDVEKKQRLEKLESAVQRIERVRALLASGKKFS